MDRKVVFLDIDGTLVDFEGIHHYMPEDKRRSFIGIS